MWKLLKKYTRKKLPGKVSLTFRPDGILIAHFLPDQDGFVLNHATFLKCSDSDQKKNILQSYVSENELTGLDCVCVLQPSDYRLLLIDTPEVDKAELQQACRWVALDFVDFPADDVGIDVFDAPMQSGRTAKTYVIVVRLSFLKTIADLIQEVGLKLVAVDILELAMTHALNGLNNEGSKGIASLLMSLQGPHVIAIHNHMLVLERCLVSDADGFEIPSSDDMRETLDGELPLVDNGEQKTEKPIETANENNDDYPEVESMSEAKVDEPTPSPTTVPVVDAMSSAKVASDAPFSSVEEFPEAQSESKTTMESTELPLEESISVVDEASVETPVDDLPVIDDVVPGANSAGRLVGRLSPNISGGVSFLLYETPVFNAPPIVESPATSPSAERNRDDISESSPPEIAAIPAENEPDESSMNLGNIASDEPTTGSFSELIADQKHRQSSEGGRDE
ncbi:MAG: hypothetical protein A3H43_05195 [Gammaproteobacteria bacterium RIFCSPLOWO2_02_FULL_42_9]|nr:MAG: hypothetical protein A3H43_05195 [Gammaproteobacteria bacterium RIFCSPLOWO2_02_FULL_42_9]